MLARALSASLVLLLAAPALAAPSGASGVSTTGDVKPADSAPWAGTSIDWAHVASFTTFNKAASLSYDPTYVQSFYFLPQWAFTPWLTARGRIGFDLELTNADDTTNYHEAVLSDGSLELITSGWKEPASGIRLSGGVRLVLPFSKSSQYQNLRFALGPALSLSRRFDNLNGLTVGFSGRFTGLSHALDVSRQNNQPLASCADRTDDTCLLLQYGVVSSVWGSLSGGPSASVELGPLTFSGELLLIRSFTSGLPVAVVPIANGTTTLDAASPFPRDYSRFVASVSWQATKELSLSLTGLTSSPEFAPDGSRYSPIYNRNSIALLDLNLDVEAFASRFSR